MKRIVLSVLALMTGAAMIGQEELTSADPQVLSEAINVELQEEAPADTSWKTGGVFGLNFGQTALQNWAGGGVNSITIGGLFNHFRNYKKDDWSWDNNLDLAYGMLWQGENDGVKTDDRIDFTSKVGKAIKKDWYAAFLLNLRTQFAEGFDDPFAADSVRNVISKFMAPGFGLASLGIDYKPSEQFTAYISPMTAKFTIVNDDDLANAGAFGVQGAIYDDVDPTMIITEGEKLRTEFGAYARAQYVTDLMENINFLTKIDLFANYETITLIDINWEVLLSMKVNEYISATLGTQVLYDHDVKILRNAGESDERFGPVTQFREVLNIGFVYNF